MGVGALDTSPQGLGFRVYGTAPPDESRSQLMSESRLAASSNSNNADDVNGGHEGGEGVQGPAARGRRGEREGEGGFVRALGRRRRGGGEGTMEGAEEGGGGGEKAEVLPARGGERRGGGGYHGGSIACCLPPVPCPLRLKKYPPTTSIFLRAPTRRCTPVQHGAWVSSRSLQTPTKASI